MLCFAGYRLQRIGIALIGFLLGAGIGMSIAGDREGLAWLAIVLGAGGRNIIFRPGLSDVSGGDFPAQRYSGVYDCPGAAAFAHLPGWANIAGGAVIGIVVGILAVKFTRPVLILTTALQGSFGVVRHGLTLLGENPDQPGGWMLYASIAAAVVLAVLGICVQRRTSPEK